jgi:hypothetical protein
MIAWMQLIVFFPLMMIRFPPNIMLFFKGLIQIATYEILYTDKWAPQVFSLTENEPVDSRFKELDFETKILILNMGTLYIFFLFLII